jgi:hypothetical protein
MTIEIWLWVALAAATSIYVWVGKVLVSQPAYNRPPIFYSDAAVAAALATPLLAYVTLAGAIW